MGIGILLLTHLVFFLWLCNADPGIWIFWVALAQLIYGGVILMVLNSIGTRNHLLYEPCWHIGLGVVLAIALGLLIWPGICGSGAQLFS